MWAHLLYYVMLCYTLHESLIVQYIYACVPLIYLLVIVVD